MSGDAVARGTTVLFPDGTTGAVILVNKAAALQLQEDQYEALSLVLRGPDGIVPVDMDP